MSETIRINHNSSDSTSRTIDPVNWTDGHWHVVDSSNLKAVRYDESGNAEVRFKSAEYIVKECPMDVFCKMVSSPSVGEAYNELIKDKYEVIKK